jgi:hypothetical protein
VAGVRRTKKSPAFAGLFVSEPALFELLARRLKLETSLVSLKTLLSSFAVPAAPGNSAVPSLSLYGSPAPLAVPSPLLCSGRVVPCATTAVGISKPHAAIVSMLIKQELIRVLARVARAPCKDCRR